MLSDVLYHVCHRTRRVTFILPLSVQPSVGCGHFVHKDEHVKGWLKSIGVKHFSNVILLLILGLFSATVTVIAFFLHLVS